MKASRPLLRVPVPLRLAAIVFVAILIPSILITALGLFAVFRAEPMVREELAYPVEQSLDRLRDRLSREWEHRFRDLQGRAAAAASGLPDPWASAPHVSAAYLYRDGAFQFPRRSEKPEELEASPADPELARARDLEFRKRDASGALLEYRSVIARGSPEAVVDALLGAARCQRDLGNWQEAIQTLRRVVDRFGETVDHTAVARGLPALLGIVELSREKGDAVSEGLAVRELAAQLRRRGAALDPGQRAFYGARLRRYPEAVEALQAISAQIGSMEATGSAETAGSAEAAEPAGASGLAGAAGGEVDSPVSPGRPFTAEEEEILENLRLHTEEHAASAPGYHRVLLQSGVHAVLAFFSASGGLLYLRLDPEAYLRDVRFFSRELNLSEGALRFTDGLGRLAGPRTSPGYPEVRPLASRTLPRPLSHLSAHYYPATGEVSEELRRLETSRVALFTWSIIVLVLMILLGVSLTLRAVFREMRVTRLKSDFVGFITHELKTPLTAIRMFAETLLLNRVPEEGERERCLQLIDKEAARLTRLIDQILEFSKIEKRQRAFKFSSANMAEVVDEAVRIFLEHNRESGCEVEVNKAQEHISRVKMDRAAMVELLLNLLSNALKYSRDSKKIVVNVRESINAISVEVVDRGIGIPKREQRKIFEQFYRAEDYLTREVEGSGLGLTFARYIAKVHGGEIRVQSTVNLGSTFTLELRKEQVLSE